MSRKPPKKSDMGKSWMKPRRDSRQMISPEYHLIVSEGTKTEPPYIVPDTGSGCFLLINDHSNEEEG